MKRLVEHIVKGYLLKESLSRIVYHFTDIDSLITILEENKFKLSSCLWQRSETYSSKLFYFCTTRQFNGDLGYSPTGGNIRIHLDGDLLNQNYSGKAIDFWSVKDTSSKQRMVNAVDIYQSEVEGEDRLFSNKSFIDNAIKYIKRIDINLNIDVEDNSDDEQEYFISVDLKKIKYLCKKLGIADKLCIFKTKKDFNNPYSKNIYNNIIPDTTFDEDKRYIEITQKFFYEAVAKLENMMLIIAHYNPINQNEVIDIKSQFHKFYCDELRQARANIEPIKFDKVFRFYCFRVLLLVNNLPTQQRAILYNIIIPFLKRHKLMTYQDIDKFYFEITGDKS